MFQRVRLLSTLYLYSKLKKNRAIAVEIEFIGISDSPGTDQQKIVRYHFRIKVIPQGLEKPGNLLIHL